MHHPAAVLRCCPEMVLVLPVTVTEASGTLNLAVEEAAEQGQLCSPAGYRLLWQHADCLAQAEM